MEEEKNVVSFFIADLAEKIGYNIECRNCYILESQELYLGNYLNDFNQTSWAISAPIKSDFQTWLRNKHNTHVQITIDAHKNGINYMWQVLIYNSNDPTYWDELSPGLYGDDSEYSTYELALDAGLRKALIILLSNDPLRCRNCYNYHKLADFDAGSDREIERLCLTCYNFKTDEIN